MYERRRMRKNNRKKKARTAAVIAIACAGLAVIAGIIFAIVYFVTKPQIPKPEETLEAYISYLQSGNYEAIYDLLNEDSKTELTKEELVARYQNIYNGVEATDITVTTETELSKQELINRKKKQPAVINYTIAMNTLAGPLTIPSSTILTYEEASNSYRMVWKLSEIFPGLKPELKVRVEAVYGERGVIYDSYQNPLAVKGEAWSVGIVPGKLTQPKEESIQQIAEVLDLAPEKIEKALAAKWVKDDLFVPLRTISKGKTELKEQLLEIPGVLLSTVKTRVYPEANTMGHLVGYVQNITAEELEKRKGKRYNVQSVIGKAGIEYALEDTLRSQDGYRIILADQNGNEVSEVLSSEMYHGKDVRLTIISFLQEELYRQMEGEKGVAIALNPATGDVLALVSTPSYDSNDFAFGFTSNEWARMNEDTSLPLYNRVKGTWCPGSSLKPVVGALALDTKSLKPEDIFENSGLSWQKDESWGAYQITTLHDYAVKNLENALLYSDNIFFAKTALAIGKEKLQIGFETLGFGEKIPFSLNYTSSSVGKDNLIGDEIQLADSGYGQGQMLVNPLHLACMYSAFYNEGNMITPNLIWGVEPKVWKEGAFSKETSDLILKDLVQVVQNPEGTGHGAQIEGKVIAGKTGTAELKASKEDTSGTELGWFVALTAEETENPIEIVMMIEDVKERGGSHFVVPKVKAAIECYYQYREKKEQGDL